VFIYALFDSEMLDDKEVFIKESVDPPMLNTGHENRAKATPMNPNV